MARVYERGGRWYYEFRRNGRHVRRSAGAEATKDDALTLLGKALHKAKDGDIYGVKPEPVGFGKFADEWLGKDKPLKKSKDRDRDIVEMLKVQWRGQDLGAVSTEMIEDYKAKRLGTKKRPNRAPALTRTGLQLFGME